MSNSQTMDSEEKRIRQEIDDYEFTCQVIVTLNNIITFNWAGSCRQKKFKTTANNVIQPDTEVTPDLAIEIKNEALMKNYKAIGEIKVNLPRKQEFWKDTIDQIRKYDDELMGWAQTNENTHDLYFMTNPMRTYAFDTFCRENMYVQRPFSIFSCTPMKQQQNFIFIKKEYGKLSDIEIDEKMSNGVSVAEHNLINILNQTKFFDSEPPVYYTMIILWDHIFKNFLDENDFRILSKNQIVRKTISVDNVFNIIQKFAPLSEENTVKKKWITKALKKFVEIKVAKFVQNESFEIKLKKRKDETITWILKEIKEIPSVTLDEYF